MTHQFMSKELTLPAYSISNFLPRFKLKKKNSMDLIYFICSIIQQDTEALSRVGACPKGREWDGGGECALWLSRERVTGAWEWETSGFCFRSLILPQAPCLDPFCTSEQPGPGIPDSGSLAKAIR